VSSCLRLRRVSSLSVVPASLSVLALTAPAALGSAERLVLTVSGELKKPGVKVAKIGWGTIKISNRPLGFLECVAVLDGNYFNETEPGTSTERAYGEVEQFSATSFLNVSGGEQNARCKTGAGFEAWITPEAPLRKTLERVTREGTERLDIRSLKRGSLGVPWLQEAEGTENTSMASVFYMKTGIAQTERSTVEAEEAAAGVPTERRTGCYPYPALTEVERSPGLAVERETELVVRPDPKGCIHLTFVAPEFGIETPIQGTLQPEFTNGARNALTPSKLEFKGAFIGVQTEIPSERSSERDERHLENGFGPWYVKSLLPVKEMGFLHDELLGLK
jgi:hypothetical protein